MKCRWAMAMVVAATGWLGQPAAAQETMLIFGTGGNPQTPVVKEIYTPWVAAVNAAGKGVVQVDQRDGQVILNTANFYNQVTNDVVQIAFGSLNYVIGKFPLSSVTALPLELGDSEIATVAFWRLYKSGVLDSDFTDVVPLYVLTYPPTWFHFRKPLASTSTLKGLKIAPNSKFLAEMTQEFGGDPVTMTYQEIYSALQRGTIDGFSFPMAGIYSQNFGDITAAHLDMNLGSSTSSVFMTKAKFDGLSAEARKVLQDASGEAMSRKQGILFDRLTNEAIDKFKADPKHSIVQPSATMRETWTKFLAKSEANWIADGGADRAKRETVLAQYKTQLEQVKAGR